MKSILEYQDYISFLKDYYFSRVQDYHEYSFSCLAEELGIHVSSLSRILNGRRGPSKSSAQKICDSLCANLEEKEHLLDLIALKHSKSKLLREQAWTRVMQRLQKNSNKYGFEELQILDSWLDHALRQACFVFNISPFKKPLDLAKYFQVSLSDIEISLKKLVQLKMIEDKGGYYRPTKLAVYFTSGKANEVGKKINKEFIQHALKSIDRDTVDKRYASSTLVCIQEKKMKQAQEALEKFRRDFTEDLSQESEEEQGVYCLGLQFFELGVK